MLTVADTGMGISEKNLPHVFDRFWQADGSSKRKYQGVGIGLALVKELVEIQGGEVTVAEPGRQGHHIHGGAAVSKGRAGAERPARSRAEIGSGRQPMAGTVTSEEWLANLYRRAELFPALTPLAGIAAAGGNRRAMAACPRMLVADDEPDMLRFLKSQLSAHYRGVRSRGRPAGD